MREVIEGTGITCSVGDIRDKFATVNPSNDINIFNVTHLQGHIPGLPLRSAML